MSHHNPLEETLSEQPLTSLSLTHVEFNPKDSLAYAYAYITLSPLIILVSYVSIIIARRELMMINMFLGQLFCELLNSVLKKWIKEKRPNGTYIYKKSGRRFCQRNLRF